MLTGSVEYTVDSMIRCRPVYDVFYTYRIRIYIIVFFKSSGSVLSFFFFFFFEFYLQENTPGNGGELWLRQGCVVLLLGIAMEATRGLA
jgi:hypothetical protein